MHRIIDFEHTGKAEFTAFSVSAQAETTKSITHAVSYKKATVKRSINNYLKTPEEIEAELVFTAHFSTDTSNVDSLPKTTTDGYFNTHSSVEGLSGTMEENY